MRELSLNVLDIAQNSITAGATLVTICVAEKTAENELVITVEDNGCGMTREQIESVTDPFYTTRTTRKVGMGVPLFKMAAQMSGGDFRISSELGKGTTVSALFKTDSVDFVPLGDMCSTMLTLITMNTGIDFIYRRSVNSKEFTLDTRKVKEILGDVPLNEPSVTAWLKDYINENTQSVTEE